MPSGREEPEVGTPAAARPGEVSIRVDDLHFTYGDVEVLHGVHFTVRRGEVTGLLGPNGAGKSTTLRVLIGVGPVAAGCVGAPAPSQGVAPTASARHADPGVTASPRGPQSPGTTVASENAEDVEFARGTVAWDTPGLTLPKVVHEVHPSYTAAAMRAKIEGKVLLEVVVLPDGTVGRARILKSLDAALGLDTQALAAARQWTFTPAAVNGTPVTVRCVMSMSFRVV